MAGARDMQHNKDRILVTHVGSLPRSTELMKFLTARDTKQDYDEAAFRACLKNAVGDIVRKQVDFGIDIVNDGELSKLNFSHYARERLGGLEQPTGGAAQGSARNIVARDARDQRKQRPSLQVV